jgi:hypothetical protein
MNTPIDPDLANQKPAPSRFSVGPALWIFGSLVWTFVVAGEFTTAGFISEEFAVVAVLVVTITTGTLAIRRALAGTSEVRRRTWFTIGATLGVSLLFIAGFAAPVQTLNGSSDVGMTFLLLLIGIGAAWFGRRWSGPPNRPLPTPVTVSLLTAGVVLTLGTIVHVLAVN